MEPLRQIEFLNDDEKEYIRKKYMKNMFFYANAKTKNMDDYIVKETIHINKLMDELDKLTIITPIFEIYNDRINEYNVVGKHIEANYGYSIDFLYDTYDNIDIYFDGIDYSYYLLYYFPNDDRKYLLKHIIEIFHNVVNLIGLSDMCRYVIVIDGISYVRHNRELDKYLDNGMSISEEIVYDNKKYVRLSRKGGKK